MTEQTLKWRENIFSITDISKFTDFALDIFHYQAKQNQVYSEYLKLLKINPDKIDTLGKIPFLPVGFFKTHQVISGNLTPELLFESSRTTGQVPSRHFIVDRKLYIESFTNCFKIFFGHPSQYGILALLPSYLDRKNSSLVFMANELIRISGHPLSGFFLDDYVELSKRLKSLEEKKQKTCLLGVSFALIDFAEKFPIPLKHTIIIETGGMKGRRAELTRTELHAVLKKAFAVQQVYSEYGMTELLSQAYSTGDGVFKTPPWMKILIRNPYDPFEIFPAGRTGGINIIDLANIHSCAFIQTDDLGKLKAAGTFEVLGRIDNAELRGCNLMVE